MKKYTVGFMFDKYKQNVALIEKARPDWQKGYLNGIGGHIESGETAFDCMVREFEEETGLKTLISDWELFAVIRNSEKAYELNVF